MEEDTQENTQNNLEVNSNGQVRIRTKYRSINDMYIGINAFETYRQTLLNKLNGRCSVLRDNRGLV